MTLKKLLLSTLLLISSTAQASLIIDDFSTDQFVIDNQLGSTFATVNGSGILGDERDAYVFDSILDVSGGTAKMSPITSNGDPVTLSYDGLNGDPASRDLGLAALDLSAAGSFFSFDVLSVSGDVALESSILYSPLGRGFITSSYNISQTGNFQVSLADFTGSIGSFDISDVRSITFRFRLDGGELLEIDNLALTTTTVSEPPLLLLFLSALLLMVHRKLK